MMSGPVTNRHWSVDVSFPPARPASRATTILRYGLLGGLLIAALQAVEYRWLVLDHSVQM